MKSSCGDDELQRLEREVRHRLSLVNGLLKLRTDVAADCYKSHFEQVILQFGEIEDHIAVVQGKIDRELAMLHQVQAVIQASEAQRTIVRELQNKIQSSEALQAISDLRNKASDNNRKITPRSGDTDLSREIPLRTKNSGSKRATPPRLGDRERRYNTAKDSARNVGIYSRDRDAFNRYIL